MAFSFTLFTAQAVDGSSAAYTALYPGHGTSGTLVNIQIAGTWNSVTVTPEISLDDGTTWDAATRNGTAVSYTADATDGIVLAGDAQLRLTVSGTASPAPSLNAWVSGIVKAA